MPKKYRILDNGQGSNKDTKQYYAKRNQRKASKAHKATKVDFGPLQKTTAKAVGRYNVAEYRKFANTADNAERDPYKGAYSRSERKAARARYKKLDQRRAKPSDRIDRAERARKVAANPMKYRKKK